MRGRLPEKRPLEQQREQQQQQQQQQQPQHSVTLPNCNFESLTSNLCCATLISDETIDEVSFIQEHIDEVKANIQESLTQPLVKIAPYIPTSDEHLALLSIARVVQNDMQALQDLLSRCGRPPDQRDGVYIPAPSWDFVYLNDMIQSWDEPIALEPDYYLLRSMCLFELGISIQVSVLGREKVQKYMNMSLILAKRGERILKSMMLGLGNRSEKFWRFQIMMSYIYQHQASILITEAHDQEAVGIHVPELISQIYELALCAIQCSYRGLRWHPNISDVTSTTPNDCGKGQEWIKIANLAESCFQLANDHSTRQTWYNHTLKALKSALYESRTDPGKLLGRIAKIHLEFAFWIYEQNEKQAVMAPGSSQKCAEMKNASIAALVFASQAVVATKDNEYQSKQFHLVIDTLHMMALAFKSPDLIHLYIREASQWIIKLEIMFPNETVDPTYIYSANFMASKDQAMHAIAQHRQNHL